MTRKIKTVIGALRHTLAALAERRGLRLTVGGDTASTNGKVVNLPVLPEEDEVAALLAEGYVDHEAAHVRWTNFSVPNNRWFNILEDVRIERLQGETYPGAKINLRRLAAALAGGPEDVVVPPDDKPIAQFQAWLLARERRLVLGHDALGDGSRPWRSIAGSGMAMASVICSSAWRTGWLSASPRRTAQTWRIRSWI